MSKKKYWISLVVIIGILGVVGTGWRLMSGPDNDKQHKKRKASSTPYSSQSLNVSDNTNSISLTNPEPKSSTSNTQSLMPNTASNDISLNPGTGSNSGRPSAEAMLDPSTFSQYDKYKNDKAALFADLNVGNGAELTANKKAAVYYKGWLTDGKLFDMSRADEKGELQPFIFTLGAHQVIAGWEQALEGMKVGGVRFVIVPPAVGYGAQGQGGIPGNSVLIFQVQLLAVE